MKLENNIVTLRKMEFLKKDNREEEPLFLEDEEEPEEVKLDVMPMETREQVLGMSLEKERRRRRISHFSKHKSMWKQKEERTS
jgi:hypothetical protein